ncbi:uncharacterized protein LOC144742689 isoform X1 [Ciona intestinalis]
MQLVVIISDHGYGAFIRKSQVHIFNSIFNNYFITSSISVSHSRYNIVHQQNIDCVSCHRQTAGIERGLLTVGGVVVEGSSSINFLDQRKKAMRTWWEYAANTRQRATPSQQKVKVVESSTTCTLPHIPENQPITEGEGHVGKPPEAARSSTPKLPLLTPNSDPKSDMSDILEKVVDQLHPNIPKILIENQHEDDFTSDQKHHVSFFAFNSKLMQL